MTDERPDIELLRDETAFSEGVGGLPELDEDERATIGDVDGDNVEADEELR